MKENPYFKIEEFKCKCGKCEMPENMPPDDLIDILVSIREHFSKPLKINSGYRCPEHNKKVNGAPKSRHVVGDAADFVVKDVPTKEVMRYVLQTYGGDQPYGIAVFVNVNNPMGGFVHFDVRGVKARWGYNTAGKEFMEELNKEDLS